MKNEENLVFPTIFTSALLTHPSQLSLRSNPFIFCSKSPDSCFSDLLTLPVTSRMSPDARPFPQPFSKVISAYPYWQRVYQRSKPHNAMREKCTWHCSSAVYCGTHCPCFGTPQIFPCNAKSDVAAFQHFSVLLACAQENKTEKC